MSRVHIVMYPDGNFAVGGGSSTGSHIRAFVDKTRAKRSAAQLPSDYPVWNAETHRYGYKSLGKPEPVEFAPVDELKIKINNVLVLHGVDPDAYRKIMAILEGEE